MFFYSEKKEKRIIPIREGANGECPCEALVRLRSVAIYKAYNTKNYLQEY